GQQGLERTESQHVVADVIEQVLLLCDRQHQVLDSDDLVDDVADFLACALGIEFGERGKVNRFNQGTEDQRLGLKIGLRSSFGLNRRRAVGGRRLRRLAHRAHRCDPRHGDLGADAPATLAEHRSGSFALARPLGGNGGLGKGRLGWRADHFFLRPNLAMSGSRIPFLGLRASARPASVEARSTKICAVLPLGSISAIICPLLAAAPNSFASCGMIAVGSVSTALANSAEAISGRLSMPTPFRMSRDGASLRRAPFTLSIRFFVLRRFARSGLATTMTSSAETRIRRAHADHKCGISSTIQGVEARMASSSESNEASLKSRTRSRVEGAARRLSFSPHLESRRSTRVASTRSGANTASAT